MPVTPFHFGPGAVVHAIAPRQVSFLAFCGANVVIDLESLYNLIHHRQPVHAFLHTYVGATLVSAAIIAAFYVCRSLTGQPWMPERLRFRRLSERSVAIGSFLGAYSHVVLDSVMHFDIEPWAPFSSENSLYELVSLGDLHWWCLVAGFLGALGAGMRKLASA